MSTRVARVSEIACEIGRTAVRLQAMYRDDELDALNGGAA